jgi:hypothetical protein
MIKNPQTRQNKKKENKNKENCKAEQNHRK